MAAAVQQLGVKHPRRLRHGAAAWKPQATGCRQRGAQQDSPCCAHTAAPTLSLLRSTRVAGCSGCGGRAGGGGGGGLTGQVSTRGAGAARVGGRWVGAGGGRLPASGCGGSSTCREHERCQAGRSPARGGRGRGAVVMVPAPRPAAPPPYPPAPSPGLHLSPRQRRPETHWWRQNQSRCRMLPL